MKPLSADRQARSGFGVVKIREGELGVESRDIADAIIETFHAPGYTPPVVPSVAMELHELTRRPEITFQDLGRILGKDPMLAARVLRVAQSPAYAGRAKVGSLKDAAARLGLRRLADLFLETALSARIFRAKGFEEPMDHLMRHSVIVAHAARTLAPKVGVLPDHAYLCGLLHDIGYAAAIIVFAEGQATGRFPAVRFDVVAEAIASMHADASGIIAQLWGLPPAVQIAILNHQRWVGDDGVILRDSALLVVAHEIMPAPPTLREPELAPAYVSAAARGLGLDEGAIAAVREIVRRDAAAQGQAR